MKDLLNKATSGAASAVLFCIGCVMAGIGLSVVMLLAMFALAAAGLSVLASPLVTMTQPKEPEDQSQTTAA